MAEPRRKMVVWLVAMVAAAIAVVAWCLYLEVRGPVRGGGPAPAVSLAVLERGKSAPVQAGGKLSPDDVLVPRVSVHKPTRVCLVHIDVGHGMEALVLNQRFSPGEHAFDLDGGALVVSLSEMSGPQKLAAVAADRDLTQDEALSAARGTPVPGAGVASFGFDVAP